MGSLPDTRQGMRPTPPGWACRSDMPPAVKSARIAEERGPRGVLHAWACVGATIGADDLVGQRVECIVSECREQGLDLATALRSAADMSDETGAHWLAAGLRAEAARVEALPRDWSGGAPSEVRP